MKALNRTALVVAVACMFTVGLTCGTAWAATSYTVTDLGTFGGTISLATGINASGQVVGEAYTSGNAGGHAFLYDGTMHDLGTLSGGSYSLARGINDNGQVVGGGYTNGFLEHAFLYDGTMHDLGNFGGATSVANGINNNGQLVGNYGVLGNPDFPPGIGTDHAFLYDGTMHDLGGGDYSSANAINASGQVVGLAHFHAFLYNGTMHDLGTLAGGLNSVAYGINASAQVVGSSQTNTATHAFLYDGTMHDLGTLPGFLNSFAYGINVRGQVVGESYTNFHVGEGRAFLYSKSAMSNLNDLAQLRTGTTIQTANAINDFGQIAATSADHALLLTPVNKYKQGNWGAAEPAPWANTPINPAVPGSDTFAQSGCTVSSLATAVSLFGLNETPLEMSQWISGASLWYRDKDKVTGNVVATDQANVGSFWIRRDDGSKITAVRQGGQNAVPFDYDDIVAQLRQGRPVMLAVPTLGGDNPEGAKGVRHYIVAFGLDMSAPSTGPVDPSQIFISDPGYGSGTYKNVDGTGFDDTAIAPVRNLTLAQYFSVLNSGSKLKNGAPSRAGTICQDWLDSGRYYDNGTLKTLSSDLRPTLITEFAVGAGAANSAITVHSPVEVVITDRTTGQRYASSSDVALPGDIVLARTGEDLADDVTATDPILTTDPFPAYSLMLPNALYGKSLDLSIIGTGSGSYTVDYQSGSDQVQASAPLTGFINDGDTITGQFDVTVTPEPSTLLLLALGATGLLNKRAKRREIGRRQMP